MLRADQSVLPRSPADIRRSLSEAKFFKRGAKKRRSHVACKALKKLLEGYHGDHIEHLRAEIEDHHGEIE